MLCSWSSRLHELNAHLQPPFRHAHTHTRLRTWRCFVSCNLTAFGQNNKPGQQRSPTEHNKLSIPGATDTKSQARQCATAHYKREASDRGLPFHPPPYCAVALRGGGAKVCCIFLQHKINRNSSKFCRLVSGWVWNASHTHTHTQSTRQAIYICMSGGVWIWVCVCVWEYPLLRHNKMEFIFKQLPLARLLCQRKYLGNQKSLNSTRLAQWSSTP